MQSHQNESNSNKITFKGVVFDKSLMTQKEIQRLELDIAMEAFLNSGNSITELAQGETVYPDGKLPPIVNQKARSSATPIDPSKTHHVAEDKKRGELISEAKGRATRYSSPKDPTKSKKSESTKPKTPKTPKPPANKLPPEELNRRKSVREAYTTAVLNGEKHFEAMCAVHKLTRYAIYAETYKCLACVAARRTKYLKTQPADPSRAWRSKVIAQRREIAIQNGETEFIGVCREHGETLYKIYTHSTRCHACYLESSQKSRTNARTPEEQSEHKRKMNNKLLIAQAIAEGVREFEATCKNCGPSIFRLRTINPNTDKARIHAFCLECTRKLQRKKSDDA